MSKWEVGNKVRFDWSQGTILSGIVLQVKERRFRQPIYRIAYGVGDFGYKVSDNSKWVRENDIFPYDIGLIQGKTPRSITESKKARSGKGTDAISGTGSIEE